MSDKDNSTGAAGREAGGAAECGTFGEGEAAAGGAWLVLQEISPAGRKRGADLPARYGKTRPVPPGLGSTAPKRKREPDYSRAPVAQVRGIRKEDPTYSGKKIRPILLRSMAERKVPSVATIGRLISRENLFFRHDTKLHRKRPKRPKGHERKRKPAGLKADGPNKVIEYDMKHMCLLGNKLYTYCAIDPCTKQAVLRGGTTPSGLNSKTAPGEVVRRYGSSITIVNDNGSENKGKAGAFPAEKEIIQYRATPYAPRRSLTLSALSGLFSGSVLITTTSR